MLVRDVRFVERKAFQMVFVDDSDGGAAYFYGIPGKSDDTLDIVLGRLRRGLEHDDISALRRMELVTYFIDNEVLLVLDVGIHRCTAYDKRTDDKRLNDRGECNRAENIE